MVCWQCGKEIYPGAFFCTNCGTKAVQPQEVRQKDPVMMVPPTGMQEPEMQPTTGSMVPPTEMQEPEIQSATGSMVPPAEMQGPEIQPATGSEAPPTESQAPMVQVPPAVIIPPAPVMQFREVQGTTPAGPGMLGSGITRPTESGIPRYVSVMPTEQKPAPKPLKKGVVVTVSIVAILVFLVGVIGAFYFAENGDDSDGGMTQGHREELEEKDSVSHREDIGEYRQLEDPDNANSANSVNPGEDPIEENQSAPWEKPMEGKQIPAFSGRDIYPDIDGYAEGKPGDAMHTYWFDYTVTGAYICTEYGGYRPKTGYEVLVVEMAVRNTFDERIPMFDDDFQAQWNDMSDNAYAWPIEEAEFLGEDVLPSYYVLEEGQVAMGLLLFEVPMGYTEFSLAYWEIFDDDTYGDLFFLDFTADRNQIDITI